MDKARVVATGEGNALRRVRGDAPDAIAGMAAANVSIIKYRYFLILLKTYARFGCLASATMVHSFRLGHYSDAAS